MYEYITVKRVINDHHWEKNCSVVLIDRLNFYTHLPILLSSIKRILKEAAKGSNLSRRMLLTQTYLMIYAPNQAYPGRLSKW